MARQMIKTTIETIETIGFALKQRLRIETNTLSQKLSLLSLLSLKKNLVKTCFLRRQVNATTPLLHNDMLMFVVG